MEDVITGAALGPRVVIARPEENYKLYLTFTNGEQRIFDVTPLLKTPVFKPLANKSFFRSVKVAYGSVLWPNDIDYCPDTLYMESVPLENKDMMDEAV